MVLRENQARARGQHPRPLLIWRPLSQMPPALTQALLLSEDDQFFHHSGFDIEHIKIAIREDWKRRKFAFGGSTLTQQLARTLYLSPRKSVFRKLKEAVITVWLERTLSKKRILELYINVVEWGRGIYGVEAAAQHYFHKPAADLTVDECVALVTILPSPRRWSPLSERAFMAQRRTNILEEMRNQGYIPDDEPSSL
jgi:monofunctional biosynthetic peptidoglycan transglycosylase